MARGLARLLMTALALTVLRRGPGFGVVSGFGKRSDQFADSFANAAGEGRVGAVKRDVHVAAMFRKAQFDIACAIGCEFERHRAKGRLGFRQIERGFRLE